MDHPSAVSGARRGDGDGGEDVPEVVHGAGDAEDALLLVPELLRRHLQQRRERWVPQRLHAHHEPLALALAVAHKHRHATARNAAAIADAVREAEPPHQLPHRGLCVLNLSLMWVHGRAA
jgi:hypothetical protein